MKTYIKPISEIIPSTTSGCILLEGSHKVVPLNPVDPIDIGGEERPETPANSFDKSLWDEE